MTKSQKCNFKLVGSQNVFWLLRIEWRQTVSVQLYFYAYRLKAFALDIFAVGEDDVGQRRVLLEDGSPVATLKLFRIWPRLWKSLKIRPFLKFVAFFLGWTEGRPRKFRTTCLVRTTNSEGCWQFVNNSKTLHSSKWSILSNGLSPKGLSLLNSRICSEQVNSSKRSMLRYNQVWNITLST